MREDRRLSCDRRLALGQRKSALTLTMIGIARRCNELNGFIPHPPAHSAVIAEVKNLKK